MNRRNGSSNILESLRRQTEIAELQLKLQQLRNIDNVGPSITTKSRSMF